MRKDYKYLQIVFKNDLHLINEAQRVALTKIKRLSKEQISQSRKFGTDFFRKTKRSAKLSGHSSRHDLLIRPINENKPRCFRDEITGGLPQSSAYRLAVDCFDLELKQIRLLTEAELNYFQYAARIT
jgi:hypothetical protein